MRVDIEPMQNLDHYWKAGESLLIWDCLFMLPPWLLAWWSHIGRGSETQLWVVKEDDEILGLAPLMISGEYANLASDSDLMDYSDFVVSRSRGKEFFEVLFANMKREGIRRLIIDRARSDSAAVFYLTTFPPDGCDVSCEPVDVLYELDLPDSWEEYLNLLSGKERHETRRKLSNLEKSGHAGLRVVENAKDVPASMDVFMTLFRSGRSEKAAFMTDAFESFFRSLAERTAAAGILKLFSLDINDTPAASAMCFDYNSTVHLYNNGYDLRFSRFSAGLMSKILSIRESIRLGRKKYNFLRGAETYKRRLGGNPMQLYRCEVALK